MAEKKVEYKLKNGKWTAYRNGKELKIGTRPKELLSKTGTHLGNAFRDILKIGRLGKNPTIDEQGRPLTLLEAQRRDDLKLKNYDDSADVAEFQKYQKQADIYNKAEGLRVQKAKDFEEEAQMYSDETGRSVDFAKRILRGEHVENTVIGGNVPPDKGGKGGVSESKASGELDREAWLKKTANSPAARAGMSDDLRWKAQKGYRRFKNKKKNKKKLSIKD